MNPQKTIQGKKGRMTQVWKNDKAVPVTVIKITDENEKGKLSEMREGDLIDLKGTSKGKGFQGVVKRHGFHGGPKSHGQKDRLRAPGSLGSTAPQRVIKGKKMAGHMGNASVTLKKVRVIEIKQNESSVLVKGAVPGAVNSKVKMVIREKV